MANPHFHWPKLSLDCDKNYVINYNPNIIIIF